MKRKKATGLFLLFFAVSVCANIRLIGENHPNLWYNQAEIETMRKMILNDRSPAKLVQIYESKVRGKMAADPPSNWSTAWKDSYTQVYGKTIDNMKAAMSYLVEPSQAKAQRIKEAIFRWKAKGISRFTDPLMNGFAILPLPFLFDLTYNAGIYSASEKAELKQFFTDVAKQSIAYYSNQKIRSNCINSTTPRLTKEGIAKQALQNHYAFYVASNTCCALCGTDQALLEYITENRCKKVYDDPLYDGFTFAETECYLRGLYQYAAGMVFPSGRSYDYYFRDAVTPGDTYHEYSLVGVYMGLEAAYHNGLNHWPVDNEAMRRALVWQIQAHPVVSANGRYPSGKSAICIRRFYLKDPVIRTWFDGPNGNSLDASCHIFGDAGRLFAYPMALPTDHVTVETRPLVGVKDDSRYNPVLYLALYDIKGKLVADGKSFQANRASLPNGIYLAKFRAGQKEYYKRIVIIK
jgi:hypothetical protein